MNGQTKLHVLIIGAGLGGLTLAQALRKQGISFQVFEKSSDDRHQGWAIGIHSVLDDLAASVPTDMPPLSVVDHLLPLSLPAQIIFYRNNALQPRIGVQDDGSKAVIRANRQRLRSWLATNIPIQWGKAAVCVEETGDAVVVHFSDGASARGDIVIGADGVHSAVRRHLLRSSGDDPVRILPMTNLVGEVVLSGQDFERQLELAHSAYIASDVGSPNGGGATLFVGLNSVNDGAKSGNYYWCLTYADSAAASLPHVTSSATKRELYNLAMSKASHLIPELRGVIEKTGAEGMITTPFIIRDLEIESLPTGRVTLLGDAAHCMTPFRGEGGVHAMRDALALARTIAEIAPDGTDQGKIESLLGEYQQEMLERGVKAVRLSRENWAGTRNSAKTQIAWGNKVSVIPQERISLSNTPLVE